MEAITRWVISAQALGGQEMMEFIAHPWRLGVLAANPITISRMITAQGISAGRHVDLGLPAHDSDGGNFAVVNDVQRRPAS